MPHVVKDLNEATIGERTRGGPGGKERTYPIDFEPLRQVIGEKLSNGKPQFVEYFPQDLVGEGDAGVAQLNTFVNQARNWVEKYNETEAGEQKYRYRGENHAYEDDSGNHVVGTVKDGQVVAVDKADGGVKLYKIKASVVPLTPEDEARRKRALKSRRETEAQKKTKSDGDGQAQSENVTVTEESATSEAPTETATKARSKR